MARTLPPVRSPLTARSLLTGLWSALSGAEPGEELGRRLLERYGARDVRLFDSGTSALRVALRLGGAGAEGGARPVALPAYCCYDIVTAAVGAERSVVLYDVDPETLAPEAGSFDAALSHEPSAVVLVHLFGVPVDVEALGAKARDAGAVVIEDAAQAAGAEIGGRLAGSFGSFTVLSFGRGKGTTGGGGGALLAVDERAARSLPAIGDVSAGSSGLRELAGGAAQWLLGRPALYGLPRSLPFLRLGEAVYREPSAPRAISRAASGILTRTLGLDARERDLRRAAALRHADVLRGREGLRLVRPPPDSDPGWLRFPVLASAFRPPAIDHVGRRLGIERGYPRPLSELPALAPIRQDSGAMPGARVLASRLLTLPTHGWVSGSDVGAIRDWIGTRL